MLWFIFSIEGTHTYTLSTRAHTLPNLCSQYIDLSFRLESATFKFSLFL